MAYGADLNDMYRLAAYVDRTEGASRPTCRWSSPRSTSGPQPQDGSALGLTFPPHLLVLADEVIQ